MPVRRRRYRRPTRQQCEKFKAGVVALLQSLGARPNDEPVGYLASIYSWRLPTRFGALFIEVQDDWVPCRFREPELVPAWLHANPHSGK